jgi:hypothetical protein
MCLILDKEIERDSNIGLDFLDLAFDDLLPIIMLIRLNLTEFAE